MKPRRVFAFTVLDLLIVLGLLALGVVAVLALLPAKPGSVEFLDSKKGMGGLVLGKPVSDFTRMGFAKVETSDKYKDETALHLDAYTKQDFTTDFGSFKLENVTLFFTGDKLVRIVGSIPEKPDSAEQLKEILRVAEFAKTMFGEPNVGEQSNAHDQLIGPLKTVKQGWRAKRNYLELETTIIQKQSEPIPTLWVRMDDARTIEKAIARFDEARKAMILKHKDTF